MKGNVIDAIDRALIRTLTVNGRLTQLQLAEIVPLSPTAIARRMRALEDAKIISGYAAQVDIRALGYQVTAVVRVALTSQGDAQQSAFEAAVASIGAITSCYLMSGEDDYVLTVAARDIADYERIHKEQLSKLPGLARMTSSFTLRRVLHNPLANAVCN